MLHYQLTHTDLARKRSPEVSKHILHETLSSKLNVHPRDMLARFLNMRIKGKYLKGSKSQMILTILKQASCCISRYNIGEFRERLGEDRGSKSPGHCNMLKACIPLDPAFQTKRAFYRHFFPHRKILQREKLGLLGV